MSDDSAPLRPPKQPSGVNLKPDGYGDDVKAAAREAYIAGLASGNGHRARRLARKACNIPIPLRTVARWCEVWDDDADVKAAAAKGRERRLDDLESMSTDVSVAMHRVAMNPSVEPKDRALAARVVIGAWGTKLRDGQPAGTQQTERPKIVVIYPPDAPMPDAEPAPDRDAGE